MRSQVQSPEQAESAHWNLHHDPGGNGLHIGAEGVMFSHENRNDRYQVSQIIQSESGKNRTIINIQLSEKESQEKEQRIKRLIDPTDEVNLCVRQ